MITKQLIFVVVLMAYFSLRSLAQPFWAVLMYYALAVLRPQAIWEWSLPQNVRWSFFAAIVAMVSTALNFTSLRARITRPTFIPMLFIFGLCVVGSYCGAINREIAAKQGWEYAKIIIMLILASFVINEKWHLRYLAWMIFLSLAYLAYEVNALYMVNHRLDILHNGYGGLDNNGAALMLAMVIPFCFYFFLAERRWFRWGFFLCIIPVAHAVMLTYSRGAMLSAILVGVGMLFATSRRRIFQNLVIAVFLGAVVLSLAGPEVRKRFLTINKHETDASAQSRFGSWKAGWKIARDYPLFGVGIRNANLLTRQYGADIEGRTIHNVYIQIAADVGFPAAAIYTGLVGLTLWRLYASAKKTRKLLDSDENRWFHYICHAAFWSLATFAFGAVFLSFETFELCYLLMLFGAVAPTLADEAIKFAPAEAKNVQPKNNALAVSTGGLSP